MTNRTKAPTSAEAAYTAFVEDAWQRHLRLALLLTGDRWQAEELLQDGLVRIYERWRRLSRTDDLHAYLRKVLVNNHTSIWRRRRRESLVAAVPDRPAPDRGVSADALVLRDALRALPPRQRAVVVLRHYEDLPEREVAAVLGCSLGTVKSQHAKALEKLRHLVGDAAESRMAHGRSR
ncbi:MAG: SigE family RNA polymerase sigma factor [Hamadaea sp.]|nr:SigE family RNA polymerase sigma factor [Hamadaea sp.]